MIGTESVLDGQGEGKRGRVMYGTKYALGQFWVLKCYSSQS